MWHECLEVWMKFEVEVGLLEATSVSFITHSRPEELSKWLKKCQYNKMPMVADVKDLADRWIAWWNSLQPKWQMSTTLHALPLPLGAVKEKEDMSSLRKGGRMESLW
ncbi:hypothetical protein BDZ97DRAFT_1984466 [Flammula alnicola]|nr:hypothetical protein BDZ97DRAFT_1984466 [Flammula alnicola]